MRFLASFFAIFFPLLLSAQEPEIVLTTGHNDQVTSLATNYNGTLMASGGLDKNIKIWEVASTKEFASINGNDWVVTKLGFHPSKNLLGALFTNDQFKLFDVNGNTLLFLKDRSFSDEFFFSKSGDELIFLENNTKINFYSITTGTVTREIEVPIAHRFAYDPVDEKMYAVSIDGEVICFDLKNSKEVYKEKIFTENTFPVTRIVFNKERNLISIAHPENNKIYLFDVNAKKVAHILTGHQTRVKDMVFDLSRTRLYSLDHEANMIAWDYMTGKIILNKKLGSFSPSWIETVSGSEVLVIADYKQIFYYDANQLEALKVFKSKANKILNFSYAANGELLASAADDISIKIWDLKQNKILHKLQGFFPCQFSPDGGLLVSMNVTLKLAVYNPKTGELVKQLDPEGELITNISFSRDGKYVAGAGWQGVILIWDITSGKIIARLKGHQGGIYNTSFSFDNKTIASAGLDRSVRIWEFKKEKLIKTIEEAHEVIASDVEFSPDGKILATCGWDRKIHLFETTGWTIQKTLEGHKNVILDIDFNSDGKFLCSSSGNNSVQESDNSIMVWNVSEGKMICRLHNPAGQVNRSVFDSRAGFLYSCSHDGMIKYWDYLNCQEKAEFMAFYDTDYMITTPDMNYMCTRPALEGISFRVGDELYSFDQFDIKFNRPDLVMQTTGKAPQQLINAYSYLYKKRLKRNEFDEKDWKYDFDLPKVKINYPSSAFYAVQSEYSFTAEITDEKFDLQKAIVSINGVPSSTTFFDKATRNVKLPLKVELIPGKNTVDVMAVNQNGNESFSQRFEVIYAAGQEKINSKLYIISIGISNYRKNEFNLTYASKDAIDVSNTFTLSKAGFSEVKTLLLTDEEFSKNDIAKINSFVEGAGSNDMVVLFFAGHGVLDKNFDYYFCPHDMNFDSPEINGISFSTIEDVLRKCKAQKKLLIMDSCHSGELDKDEVAVVTTTDPANTMDGVKFRNVGMNVTLTNEFGIDNTQHLMESVFADTRNETGATAITSAGGAEFAIESTEWKNGLFTYCLLNGLKRNSADMNADGQITVTELRKKTYEEVLKLSKGKQQPTTRSENVLLDFRIW